jgi:hypothetical protein
MRDYSGCFKQCCSAIILLMCRARDVANDLCFADSLGTYHLLPNTVGFGSHAMISALALPAHGFLRLASIVGIRSTDMGLLFACEQNTAVDRSRYSSFQPISYRSHRLLSIE